MGRFEVVKPGIEVTVQDYPGRIGYWAIGIPPSGPMDDYGFRTANRLVGNAPGDAGLEIAAGLASFRFQNRAVIAVTGADVQPKLDGTLLPLWESVEVAAGQSLSFGMLKGVGFRTYVAIAGGVDVPPYLNSRSTFAAGNMGGFEGRTLRAGDMLHAAEPKRSLHELAGHRLERNQIPAYTNAWVVEVMEGPQAVPDFWTDGDMELFFAQAHKVDRNSNRLGYRLTPLKWQWARKDGGIAGKHPSNILDNAYAVGAVNLSGDQPIIITCDGPSLGGFICSAVVVSGALWKVGQVVPGRDTIRFQRVSLDEALALRAQVDKAISAT